MYLGGQVGARVLLCVHIQRRHLRIAQVGLRVGLEHPPRQGLLVVTVSEHVLAALAHHDGWVMQAVRTPTHAKIEFIMYKNSAFLGRRGGGG